MVFNLLIAIFKKNQIIKNRILGIGNFEEYRKKISEKIKKLIFTINSTIIIHGKIHSNFCENFQKDIKFEDSAIFSKSRNPLDVGCSDSNFLFFTQFPENTWKC